MSEIEKRWEHIPHGADIGVRGIGPTKADAFEQAALALTGVITDPAALGSEMHVEIQCEAPDDELLLMDWLNALVFEMSTRKLLFSRFDVELKEHVLNATAWGEAIDVARHAPAVEVKGATLTGLSVRQEANGAWVAECVVDV
jgi:tRNA nucleotidyltransferase (CCA-adding enzyme)